MSVATVERDQTAAYRLSVQEVLATFSTDATLGLSEEEVHARIERYGTK